MMLSRLKSLVGQNRVNSEPLRLDQLQYEPLNKPQNIRLLHIAPGNDGKDIHCSLLEDDWTTNLSYEALSYTWGSPGTSRSITCNGCHASVSENLFHALHQLRRPEKEVTFWIDQLCINQADIEERSSQVALMGDIYFKAARVIVWLGPEDADSKVGIAHARNILERVGHLDHFHLQPENLKDLGLPPYKDKRWRALGKLLQRPWFSRMWVIQEVVMSSNAIILCGNETITVADMNKLQDRLIYLSANRSFCGNLSSGSNGVWCMNLIDKLRKMRDDATMMYSIELLAIGMASKVTDPRDKIYALLGLGKFGIKADYSKSVEEVYISYAVNYISQILPRELTFCSSKFMTDPVYSQFVAKLLVWTHSTENSLVVPSWVPDWSRVSITSLIGQIPAFTQPTGVKVPENSENEDKYGRTEISILPNHSLRLSGKLCDTISHIGTLHIDLRTDSKPHILYTDIANWYAETGVLVSHSSSTYPTGIPWQEAYRRTLALDNLGLGAGRPNPSAVHLQSTHGALRQWNSSSSITKFMAGGEKNEAAFWHDALKICGRSFFLTPKGYMGLAPYGSGKGDRIGTLLGIKTPFVLREVEGGYQLIGACYVQGIMDGEVVLSDHVPFESITLV